MGNNKKLKKPDLTKMSQLLLSGATMLSESCPDCAVPLFKKNEDIFCPNCERKALYIKNKEEIKKIEQTFSLGEATTQLRDVLTGKITFLTNQLASADTPEEIAYILDIIEKIFGIFQKIS
ncbi:MAG: Sjogren's syndrome/scleroderma autoantigen 1 family protein [Candidatus Hodarchaeales archaeon]